MQKRIPFYVTVRHISTGADISAVLFLKDSYYAFERMAVRAYVSGRPIARQYLRLVSCDPATVEQVEAHKARMAAI